MKTKPAKTKTHAEFANLLGVSRQTLTAAAAKPDAPKLGDVAAWKTYLAANGRTGSLPLDLRRQIGEARLAILKQQEIAAIRENKRQAGELMPTADAIRQAAEAGAMVMSELERRDRELPPSLAGLDAVSICKRMHTDTEAIRKTLKERFAAIGKL